MISKYNEFISDKQFESIINEIFNLLESNKGKWENENTIVWELDKKDEDEEKPIQFEWDLTKPSIKDKLKKFLSNLPKEKIRKYFFKFLESMKKLPKPVRKKLFLTYSFIFMSFVSISYLVPDELNNNNEIELVSDYVEEIEDIKSENEEVENKQVTKTKKSNFKDAQGIVKQVEAGYSADRKDRGNFVKTPYGKRFLGTNHGISAPILTKYMGKLPTKKDMEDLSYETALKIFKLQYWDPQNLDHFSDQNVANIIYDGCVNQGINGMKKVLRHVYRKNDIKIKNSENPFDKKFINKINKKDQQKIFSDIKSKREKRYKSSITFKTHGDGWLSRLDGFDYKVDKNS